MWQYLTTCSLLLQRTVLVCSKDIIFTKDDRKQTSSNVYRRATYIHSEGSRGDLETLESIAQKCQVFIGSGALTDPSILWNLLELISREVRCVCDGSQIRNKGSFDLSDSIPINTKEERVVFHLLDI